MIKLRVNDNTDSIITHLKYPCRCFITVCHISFTSLMLKNVVFGPCLEIMKQFSKNKNQTLNLQFQVRNVLGNVNNANSYFGRFLRFCMCALYSIFTSLIWQS